MNKKITVTLGDRKLTMFQNKNGQWCVGVWNSAKKRTIPYYFGTWATDPEGTAAIAELHSRAEGILNGTDQVKVAVTGSDLTVGELVKLYLASFDERVKQGTASPETYRDLLTELPNFAAFKGYGNAKVAGLRPEHFAAYVNDVVLGTRKLGPHAHRRVVAYVRGMFGWGAENGKCVVPAYGTPFSYPDTSAEAITRHKERNGIEDNGDRIATGEEVDKLLSKSQAMYKAIILLAVNCGLGPADLGRLRWNHLDLEGGWMLMPRGKTGRKRVVYLWKRTRKALLRVATLRHQKKAIAKDGDKALVFISRKGLPLYRSVKQIKDGKVVGMTTQQSISQTVGRIVGKAKVKGLTLYRLRHTFATWADEHASRKIVRVMMGHASKKITDRYIHSPRKRKQVKRAVIGIHKELWPRPKEETASGQGSQPRMRIVSDAA